ncbi:hypothetical protein [Modestobacter sp. VKM Ac-2984]|uniref:hypothetical protein n=1 Tax=Modestobacter sp. VKM Ac-2984 TaxID=3004138 RepID=UPI0022AAF74E|nr:hypothetical protein [Modestobacter sp. VKM Ac-2984]MCZ2817262.1 hypothetical protein [Modestobacter sp. VKM Ac-2984]
MTAGLLTTPIGMRKVVVDTCAVLRGGKWHNEFKPQVQEWLGGEGVAVVPGRVVAELARVAAHKGLQNGKDAGAVARRAGMALRNPQQLLDVHAARRAVLSRADVDELCRDSGDLDLVLPGDKGRCVPGDADFEVAHTVRVLTAAAHEACLVTDDGDLQQAADRLGVNLLGALLPVADREAPLPGSAVAGLPDPVNGEVLHLLGLEAAYALLEGTLPAPAAAGESFVVLSSTLVRAVQRAALKVRKLEGESRDAALAAIHERLHLLLTTGELPGHDGRAAVWATPWGVYRQAAERIIDLRFAADGGTGEPMDMHSLLVLTAAEALGQRGHAVRLVSSGSDAATDLVLTAMASWRRAGALKALSAAAYHARNTDSLVDIPLPDEGLDLGALLDKFRRP